MDIAIIDGRQVEHLIDYLKDIVNRDMGYNDIHTLRFAVDGGVKVKVNGGMWSPPIGRLAVDGH